MMRILGVETSCDETAAAVVRDGRDALSNIIASQDELHVEYGGVVPEIAGRAHVERISAVVERAVEESGAALDEMDAIAVGSRPGLIGSLVVGVAAAKALAWSLGKPLLGVDHIHAHLYAGLLGAQPAPMPALGLVVSGGHSSIYELTSIIDPRRLGATIDDAVGEAYDKVGAILGLDYPGGPRIDALARDGDDRAFDFPVSRLDPDSLDFSFSGLKTAVLYAARGAPVRSGREVRFQRDHHDMSREEKANIAASFQRAACRALLLKLDRAYSFLDSEGRRPRSLLIGGGVSANSRLRAELIRFAEERNLDLRLPDLRYCLDNAAMIAGLAAPLLEAGRTDDLTLRAIPTTQC